MDVPVVNEKREQRDANGRKKPRVHELEQKISELEGKIKQLTRVVNTAVQKVRAQAASLQLSELALTGKDGFSFQSLL